MFILSFSLLRERKYGKERGARGIPISPGPLKAAKKTASVFLDLSRASRYMEDMRRWRTGFEIAPPPEGGGAIVIIGSR